MAACVFVCVCVFSKSWFMCNNWFALTFNTFALCGMCILAVFILCVCVLDTPYMGKLIFNGVSKGYCEGDDDVCCFSRFLYCARMAFCGAHAV